MSKVVVVISGGRFLKELNLPDDETLTPQAVCNALAELTVEERQSLTDRVQEYVTYTEDTLQNVESNAIYIILVLLVLRLSTNELRRYLSHRSIELEEC